jgi:hypothetical protein
MSTLDKKGHDCPILQFIINGKHFTSHTQNMSGTELKKLIGSDHEDLFLSIEGSWEDETINNDTMVDLARQGIEHFYTGKKRIKLVSIEVNRKNYEITRGEHSVASIKKLGHVPLDYELEQMLDGQFTPLDDNAIVQINGCEVFIGHIKKGQSS